MKTLPKNYDHKEAETRWQKAWEEKRVHAWRDDQPRDNTYVIDTPPPTVSGILHMGHIFSYTQADFVARYMRMKGMDVFYPMGFDDNGLPTERLVEKSKKIRATDMSREDFIKLCEGVSEEARKEFRDLFTSVSLSVDWSQEYHTISEHSRRISQLSFLDLYNKGHAYRELKPFFWDPVDQTAIAQAEIVDKEMPSLFNDILFGVEDSDEKITIATTRPELIPACVGVFYHPDDKRYQHLKGKNAVTPLFGVKVPILEDDSVEMEKGTGIMMCCTFGDEKDIEKWRKHKLAARVILNKYGKVDFSLYRHPGEGRDLMQFVAGDPGLRRDDALKALENLKASNPDPKHPGAREKILELLKEAGLLVKSDPITHAVKCAERSGAPLEILPTDQWFVRVMDKKTELKEKSDACDWHPEWMKHRMDQWIDGLNSDWCISRQRYFGVPFPVWYSKRAGEEGKIIVASPDQLPVNPLTTLPQGYTQDEVTPDADVMDTWATSSVSPQISAGGISDSLIVNSESNHASRTTNHESRYKKLFPADLRPQAHEIIRTWAFYTIVKAHLHEQTIPWKNLMISGWCLAADKTKMSKSKGNVVTPVDLIRDKGADVVRYWASTSRLGADTAFSEDLLKIGRKLVTKLWNATSFAAIHLEKIKGEPASAATEMQSGVIGETLDRWIITRLARTVQKATEAFESYEYCDARVAIEDFFWKDFCDNYLELVKARAYGEVPGVGDQVSESAETRNLKPETLSAHHTLYHCLDAILRLFAPFLPHVTEELYSHLFDARHAALGSIHARGNWPKAADYAIDEKAENSGIAALEVLNAVRKAKSEKNVSIKFPIDDVQLGKGASGKASWEVLAPVAEDLKSAGNIGALSWSDTLSEGTASEEGNFMLGITFAAAADVA